MSNRLFQGLVHQMRDAVNAVIGVVDETATIIACSDLTKVGTTNEFVSLDLSDSHDIPTSLSAQGLNRNMPYLWKALTIMPLNMRVLWQ